MRTIYRHLSSTGRTLTTAIIMIAAAGIATTVYGQARNGEAALWRLEEINGTPVETKTTRDGMGTLGKPFLEIDMSQRLFSGLASCNQVLGKIVVNGGNIEFGSHTITALGCSERIEKQEREFLVLLGRVSSFEISGDSMKLYAGDKPVLVFKRERRPDSETGKAGTMLVNSGCATAVFNNRKAGKKRKAKN